MIYIHSGILLSRQKGWNNAIWSSMDRSRDYHTKWGQTERQIDAITYRWNLNNAMNELIYKTEI